MKQKIILVLVILTALGSAMSTQPAYGQGKGEEQPKIHAQVLDMVENKYVASGDVEISWKEYRIYADYIELDLKTKDLLAKGRVTMVSNQTVITGEKLTFNLESRSGLMYDTYGQLPPTLKYTTNQLKQVDNDTLRFKKLDFTSCTQCKPRWIISSRKGKIKKERYIDMSHVLFKIKNIPIFYLPFIRYPLQKDGRATGFLFPSIGTSSTRGFFLMNSFFWVLSPNVDTTLRFDYFGKAGIGLSEEFRYKFKNIEGDIQFYYFKYKKDVVLDPLEDPPAGDAFYSRNPSDYFLKMKHKQTINFWNTSISVNVDKQSDANFLRIFSNDFYVSLRRISRSSIALKTSPLPNLDLIVGASQNDVYFTFNNQSTSVRYTPSVELDLDKQRIWKIPGYFSLNMAYASVNRVGKSYDEEDNLFVSDITSNRVTIRPSYTIRLLGLPWMNAKLELASKHSFYPKTQDPTTREILDESLHLQYQTAGLTVTGPVFSKIFQGRHSKLKHLITPKITFRYVTKVDDDDRRRLIPVDYFDYPSYSYVGFAFTSRLLYKKDSRRLP